MGKPEINVPFSRHMTLSRPWRDIKVISLTLGGAQSLFGVEKKLLNLFVGERFLVRQRAITWRRNNSGHDPKLQPEGLCLMQENILLSCQVL